ncbi:MAG: hypothetical protein K8T25_22500 [Planctomycetia bacterium]|nr:hypothetical protein [Planctomycetia bacterium]
MIRASGNTTDNSSRTAGRSPFRSLLGAVLAVVVILYAASWALGAWVNRHNLTLDVVDIQSPQCLQLKLDALSRSTGFKVVLLGDSVVAGRALEKQGDPAWRQHNLAELLQQRLQTLLPQQHVQVVNLAMDGALPADLESTAAAIARCKPDAVVVDVGLRSFSRDFAGPGEQHSRPWLAQFDDQTLPTATRPAEALATRIDVAVENAGGQIVPLYTYRDFLQRRFLGGPPAEALARLRDRTAAWLGAPQPSAAAEADDPAMLMLKMMHRYASVDLAADNPQAAAFERLLDRLSRESPLVVAFYAQEDRTQIGDVLSLSRYEPLREQLDALIQQHNRTGRFSYLGSIPGLQPSNYLDLTHVNRQGHELMADAIATQIARMTEHRGTR